MSSPKDFISSWPSAQVWNSASVIVSSSACFKSTRSLVTFEQCNNLFQFIFDYLPSQFHLLQSGTKWDDLCQNFHNFRFDMFFLRQRHLSEFDFLTLFSGYKPPQEEKSDRRSTLSRMLCLSKKSQNIEGPWRTG